MLMLETVPVKKPMPVSTINTPMTRYQFQRFADTLSDTNIITNIQL